MPNNDGGNQQQGDRNGKRATTSQKTEFRPKPTGGQDIQAGYDAKQFTSDQTSRRETDRKKPKSD